MRLIDADALMEKMTLLQKKWKENCGKDIDAFNCVAAINAMPTVDTEPVRNEHWIWKEQKGIRDAWYQCSECNAYDLREIDVTSHYCWACGAKMDGERKEDARK